MKTDCVEVVRCKDCKYSKDTTEIIGRSNKAKQYVICDLSDRRDWWKVNDYCSYGERRI